MFILLLLFILSLQGNGYADGLLTRVSKQAVKTDLIFSSAFLGFSRHSGFIAALEDMNCFDFQRIVGTSSGSLAGSFLAAGLDATQIAYELSRQRPIELLTPSLNVRKGLFSLKGLIKHLGTILPKDFSQLKIPLGVGVYSSDSKDREFEIITDGDLPEAVAASCAIPYIFQPVQVGSRRYADGGVIEKTGKTSHNSALFMILTILVKFINIIISNISNNNNNNNNTFNNNNKNRLARSGCMG